MYNNELHHKFTVTVDGESVGHAVQCSQDILA